MQQRLVLAVALFSLVLLSSAHAGVISSSKAGYSLDFPQGWALDKSKSTFTVVHPDGSTFEGMTSEVPPNVTSVKIAALMGQAAALAAGLCSKEPATEFELSGDGWSGRGFHCNNRVSGTSPPSQTIGFTVKEGGGFHQFFFFVPRQDWNTSSERYLSLLSSLRFRS